MFIFITLEEIILQLSTFNINLDISLMSENIKGFWLLIGNAYYLSIWLLIIIVSFKIIVSLKRYMLGY